MQKVILKNVVIAYPQLFDPKEFQKTVSESDPSKAKYSVSIILDPSTKQGAENIKKCEDAITESIKEKTAWKNRLPKKAGTFLHDGDAESENAIYAGKKYVTASDRFKPLVCDRGLNIVEKGEPAASTVQHGALANVVLTTWNLDGGAVKGVFSNVKKVQIIGPGTPLGDEQTVGDDFDELEVEEITEEL